MIPIAFCSVIGLAVILDRSNTYRRVRLEGFAMPDSVRKALKTQGGMSLRFNVQRLAGTCISSMCSMYNRDEGD